MIVVIAIAVFVVFLVLGFATGGWSYFAGAFGGATKGTGGFESAQIKCETWCNSYQSAGCPDTGYVQSRLYANQPATADTNGDGEVNDCFNCLGDASCDGEKISNVLRSCECGSVSGGKALGAACTANTQCISGNCEEYVVDAGPPEVKAKKCVA